MATLQDYLGITKLRDAWPKWKANIIAINTQIINHIAGTADKHAAEHITYTGLASGTEVKTALNSLKSDINNVAAGGTDHDALVTAALVDSEGTDFGAGGFGTYLDGRLNKWEIQASAQLAEKVNVKQFGAVGDGIVDDTVAVQAAVTYCIANKKDLIVSGLCKLTSSIVINRQPGLATSDAFFTLLSNSGGGFTVSTAIPMFTSTLERTQFVRFQNLLLTSTYGLAGAYVLDDAKFMRTSFINCNFISVQCLYAPVLYAQSIYFDNCSMRRMMGTFFKVIAESYDLKVHHCLCEASGDWFDLGGAPGCSFVQNCIEGSIGATAIKIDGASGLEISGNYFEGNGCDLDFSAGDFLGVNVSGNYFICELSTNYQIKWNIAMNCVSKGNYCNGHLHYLTALSQVDINDKAVLGISNIPYNTPIHGQLIISTPNNVGALENIGQCKLLATDQRNLTIDTDFANIYLGNYAGAAIITVFSTGSQAGTGAGKISQISEWCITRLAAETPTIVPTKNYITFVASISARISVDNNSIILSYIHGGNSTNTYNTAIEVMAMCGGAVRQIPTLTIL